MKKNTVPTGHRRFMWDAKTAWRKMSAKQRSSFLRWIITQPLADHVMVTASTVEEQHRGRTI